MSGKPPLSIVVPSHSRTDLLRACLQSIQKYAPVGTQVIVVDDGSANAVVSTTAQTVAKCEVIRNDVPRGFCVSANAGITTAKADIVQLLNDDAELASDVTAALAAFQHEDVAAVAPLILRWPGDRIDSAGDSYDRGGFARPRGRGQLPIGQWLEPRLVDAASGCAAFYRRRYVLEVGGFADSFAAYFEDVDLSLRLRRTGHAIRYVPDCRVLHHGSSSYGRPRGRLLAQQSRNEERLFWRNTNGTFPELARHLVVLALKASKRTMEGTLIPWCRGRLAAWRQIAIFK